MGCNIKIGVKVDFRFLPGTIGNMGFLLFARIEKMIKRAGREELKKKIQFKCSMLILRYHVGFASLEFGEWSVREICIEKFRNKFLEYTRRDLNLVYKYRIDLNSRDNSSTVRTES